MGDGAVCLMLDSSAIMELAAERTAHLQAART
jgi:hypothetical protein